MKEYYGRELGVYTRLVTCLCNIGWEPIGSIGEQTESKEVGFAGEDFAAKSELD